MSFTSVSISVTVFRLVVSSFACLARPSVSTTKRMAGIQLGFSAAGCCLSRNKLRAERLSGPDLGH